MTELPDVREALVEVWNTSNRVTVFLVERIPPELWTATMPGYARKTVRMVCGHLHNARRMWIKTVGIKHGVAVPPAVDRYHVTQEELVLALEESRRRVAELLEVGCAQGGKLAGFPPDVMHLQAYLIAHEAHHRGQIVAASRQLAAPLPDGAVYGLWHWSQRWKEARR